MAIDIWSKSKQSEVMSHIRSKDTKPELVKAAEGKLQWGLRDQSHSAFGWD